VYSIGSDLYNPGLGQVSNFLQWFAIRVKSNFEKRVAIALVNKGLDAFLPEYKSRRRWSDRYRTIECPLFPGYVFCRINLTQRLCVVTTPGFLYIVGTGNRPTPVDDAEIESIQSVVRSGLPALPWPSLAVGQRVRIESGPLSGLEGTLLQVENHRRICVAVTLLRRGVSVEVDREWILPLPPARNAESHVDGLVSTSRSSRPLSTGADRAEVS
jgi:transcription antitermination factor NusG